MRFKNTQCILCKRHELLFSWEEFMSIQRKFRNHEIQFSDNCEMKFVVAKNLVIHSSEP